MVVWSSKRIKSICSSPLEKKHMSSSDELPLKPTKGASKMFMSREHRSGFVVPPWPPEKKKARASSGLWRQNMEALRTPFHHSWLEVSEDVCEKPWLCYCGWAKSVRTTKRNHGKRLFVGIYRGIISFQGFLGGAKWISSIHTTKAKLSGQQTTSSRTPDCATPKRYTQQKPDSRGSPPH